MDRLVPSGEVARYLGVSMKTLKNWRVRGAGPHGWVYLNRNRVSYPESEVRAYADSLKQDRPEKDTPEPR